MLFDFNYYFYWGFVMKKELQDIATFEESDYKKSSACFYLNCVEVACKENVVAVRDNKNPRGTALLFDREEWSAFVAGVKNGEFDY